MSYTLITGEQMGVNNALMDMAITMHTPVLILLGPSCDYMWGLLGGKHRVVAPPFDSRPCGPDVCDGPKRSRCLEKIGVAAVIEQID